MRLRSLRLENFRRVRTAALEFPDGLIGIVGRNGAGKSTLVESLLWGLFGHEAARTSKDLIRSQSAAPADDVCVQVEFEVEGHSYQVTRRLRGRGLAPEAAVEADGVLVVAPGAHAWDETTRYVSQRLGVDRVGFEATCVAKQGELAALSDLRPATRKRLLLGMLGVDRVEEAIQRVRSDARVVEARLTEARRHMAEASASEDRLEQAQRGLAEAERELAKVTARRSEADAAARAAAHESERLGRDRSQDQRLRVLLQQLGARQEGVWSQRTRAAADLVLIRERLSSGTRLRAEREGLADAEASLARLESLRTQWEAYHRSRSHREGLEADRARWAALVDPAMENGAGPSSVEGHLRDAVRAQEEADETFRRQGLAAERAQAVAAAHEASGAPDGARGWSAQDACPTCGRRLGPTAVTLAMRGEAQREVWAREGDELRGQWRDASEAFSLARAAWEATKGRVRELEASLVVARAAWERTRLARHEVERLGQQLKLAGAAPVAPDSEWSESAEAQARARVVRLARVREALAALEELGSREARLVDEDRLLDAQDRELASEREAATRELSRLGYATGSWEAARDASARLASDASEAGRAWVQWSERRSSRIADVARLQQEVERLERLRAEVNALEERLGWLEALAAARGDRGLLPEFKSHLIGRIRPRLARAASELVSQMTGGRYAEVRLDDEYGARLLDGGVDHPLERFSGGEVDVANLALRLAVSELVTNARGRSRLQFVALDEVFGSQDEERRRRVLDALHALSFVFRQVWVVTHLEDVRERLEHVVRVVDAPDGSARYAASWDDKA